MPSIGRDTQFVGEGQIVGHDAGGTIHQKGYEPVSDVATVGFEPGLATGADA
jgi:hypothetical protein